MSPADGLDNKLRQGVKKVSVVGISQLSSNQEPIFMAKWMLVSLEMKNEEESDEGNLSDLKVNCI